MKRREIVKWSAFAVAFLFVLYLTLHRRSSGPVDTKGTEDFYRNALKGFDPVKHHTQRAYAFEGDRDYARAAEEYKKLLKIRPDDKDLHSHMGETYYKMGMFDEAIVELEEVMRLDPENWVQREAIGDIYGEKGDSDEALRQYERALRINPDNALCNRKLGRLYYEKGEYRAAVRVLNRSLEIDPGFGEAHLGLGLAYCALGNREGALAEVKRLEGLKMTTMAAQLSEVIDKINVSQASPD
jgi:tetratricopeptide (TPR) repeat protein